MIKDYIDVGIKNDDQLVKLSAVLQRFIAGTSGGGDDSGAGVGLSDAEKEQLLSTVKKELDDLEKTNSVVEKTLDNADIPNEEKLIG